ncbi:MAG TPA: hypothetical protein VGL38_14060 [bacterium]|jgi:hypothetical protein
MKARSKVFVCLLLVCFGAFAVMVQARPAVKRFTDKPPEAQQANPYAPLPPAATVQDAGRWDAQKADNERLAQQVYERWQAGAEVSASEKELMDVYIFSRQGRDGGFGPLDSQGGPDAFGYRWLDNMAPDTATYEWIELRGDPGTTYINTWSGTHDDSYSASKHPFGFSFPFYGVSYDSFRVSTNGVMQFTTISTSLSNVCLPSTNVAGPAIFPYWDDLHLDYGGVTGGTNVVGYKNFGSYTVIEYDSVGHCCTAGNASLKFEVIAFADGRIKMQYNNLVMLAAYDSTQTIGIQANGAAGSAALTYVCNLVGIQPANGRAIWFYPPAGVQHNFACGGVASPTTGNYQPGSTVPVTFTATNFGFATEASPVKYRFNGGGVVTETTASLLQYGSEVHTFAAQITLPNTVGDYMLDVWTDLGTDMDRSNDSCHVLVHVRNCVDFTINAPGQTAGNTTGAGDDCSLRPGLDQVIQVNIPFDGGWTFSMCAGTPTWDSYMYLTSSCCGGTTIATNDDGCGSVSFSRITCQQLTAGTYYVDIEPYSSATGAWVLDVTPCVPCNITCDPNDIHELTENPADTTFYRTDPDGGCNSAPPAFGTISCGQTVCGSVFTYMGPTGVSRADSDWYAITESTPESLSVDLYSEVPVRFGIVKYGRTAPCDSALLWITSLTTSDSCTHHVISSPECRTPGFYALVVIPSVTSGIPVPRDYRMALSCFPCSPPVPPANDACTSPTPVTVAHNDTLLVLGSTSLADVTCSDTCDYTSDSRDVFYALNVTGCRLIEMKLEQSVGATSGDMHLALYAPGECCTHPALLCNDDWGHFDSTGLTWAHNHATYSLTSWLADSFATGTYLIRVGRYSTGYGPFALTIYDEGPWCIETCDSATNVTVYRVDATRADSCMDVRFTAPLAGQYQIWSTIDKNSAFTPGLPWNLDATVTVPAGANAWRDPSALVPFRRYVVRHICQ